VKRVISISFIVISTLLLLVYTIIPHHHHEISPCFVIEFCEEDNTINDEHTYHHIPDGNTESCTADFEYIVRPFSDTIKSNVSYFEDYGHTFLFPIHFLIADFLHHEIEDSFSKTEYGEYGEYINFYKSAEANQFHGLRAPPYFLS